MDVRIVKPADGILQPSQGGRYLHRSVSDVASSPLSIRELVTRYKDLQSDPTSTQNFQDILNLIPSSFYPAVDCLENLDFKGFSLKIDEFIRNLPHVNNSALATIERKFNVAKQAPLRLPLFLEAMQILNNEVFAKNGFLLLGCSEWVGTVKNFMSSIAVCQVVGKQDYEILGETYPAYFFRPIHYFNTSGTQKPGSLLSGWNASGMITMNLSEIIPKHPRLAQTAMPEQKSKNYLSQCASEIRDLIYSQYRTDEQTYFSQVIQSNMVQELQHANDYLETTKPMRTSERETFFYDAEFVPKFAENFFRRRGAKTSVLGTIYENATEKDLEKLFGNPININERDVLKSWQEIRFAECFFELKGQLAEALGGIMPAYVILANLVELPRQIVQPVHHAIGPWLIQIWAEELDLTREKLGVNNFTNLDYDLCARRALGIVKKLAQNQISSQNRLEARVNKEYVKEVDKKLFCQII